MTGKVDSKELRDWRDRMVEARRRQREKEIEAEVEKRLREMEEVIKDAEEYGKHIKKAMEDVEKFWLSGGSVG